MNEQRVQSPAVTEARKELLEEVSGCPQTDANTLLRLNGEPFEDCPDCAKLVDALIAAVRADAMATPSHADDATVVERVGLALWRARTYGDSSWEKSSRSITDEYREMARIAIAASREASPEGDGTEA